MATTGQTINDRLNAVRYALVGQGLARTVCKATTEEVLGPKKKHTDYLLACTNEPNVSIPQMACLLIERTRHTSWAVVFKSLTTIHYLMSNGNERFTQYLATSNNSFELADFMDRTTPQGYNMSNFVRRYAKYINEKVISYRGLALDLCRVSCGDANNSLKKMNMDKISKTLPVVQGQFDAILEFGVEQKDLNNGVIMYAFRLLCKDLFKLYVAYQELIINLLGRYFNLNHRRTREALDAYKGYLSRMDKVETFMKITDSIGLDKNELPDFNKAPATILTTLERHYAQMDPKKRGASSVSPEVLESKAENEAAITGGQDTTMKKEKEQSVKSELGASEKSEQPEVVQVASVEVAPKLTSEESTHIAPPKPSRPSPVSTLKRESPQRPSNKTSSATCPSSGLAPTPAAPTPEKKAPPSRPPPPTAQATQPASSVSSSGSNSGKVSETKAPKVSSPGQHPPPPPPPPLAHPIRPPSPAVDTTTRPITDSQSLQDEETKEEEEEEANNPPNGDANVAVQDGVGAQQDEQRESACQQVEEVPEQLEHETNHVAETNGNEQNGAIGGDAPQEAIDEMPPPPPPLEEDGEIDGQINASQPPPPPPPPEVEDASVEAPFEVDNGVAD